MIQILSTMDKIIISVNGEEKIFQPARGSEITEDTKEFHEINDKLERVRLHKFNTGLVRLMKNVWGLKTNGNRYVFLNSDAYVRIMAQREEFYRLQQLKTAGALRLTYRNTVATNAGDGSKG